MPKQLNIASKEHCPWPPSPILPFEIKMPETRGDCWFLGHQDALPERGLNAARGQLEEAPGAGRQRRISRMLFGSGAWFLTADTLSVTFGSVGRQTPRTRVKKRDEQLVEIEQIGQALAI